MMVVFPILKKWKDYNHKMNTQPCFVYYLIDESGSMLERKDFVLNGIQEFLQTQSQLPNCHVSLYSFSDGPVKALFEEKDASSVRTEDLQTYAPDGFTALYDAMGFVLQQKIDLSKEGKHVFIVVTDGEENTSRLFKRAQLRELLESKRARGLEMMFLGSNQDAVMNGTGLGTQSLSCLEYEDEFLPEALRSVSQNLFRFRSEETQTCEFTETERTQSRGCPTSAETVRPF